jgi:hypothetical protein
MFNQKGAWLFPMLDGGLRGKAAFPGRSHLSPDGGGFTRAASTAWQRMSTIRQRTIRFLGRSHLSPDGGGFTRAAVHRLAADVYDSTADDSILRP